MSTTSQDPIQKILEQFDGYITSLARKSIPQSIVHIEMIDLEIDDLIQNVRIKLWLALKRQHLKYIKAYIKCIVQTEVVDMIRRHKPILPLPVDEDGELYQGRIVGTHMVYSEGMQDPSYEFEHEERFNDCVARAAEAICELPARQRYALICSLKDRLDECLQLVTVLKERGQDIEKTEWPENKDDQQTLRASLYISRKKLRSIEGIMP